MNDTIDISEVGFLLFKKKSFIFIFTLIITLSMSIYQYYNNPTALYKGSLMVKIGNENYKSLILSELTKKTIEKEDNISDTLINLASKMIFDTPRDLKLIVERLYPSVQVKIPYASIDIIEIFSLGINKNEIKNNIYEAYEFILKRHQKKMKTSDMYVMTKEIGPIMINDKPINKPKKLLIIILTFFSSFIIAAYIVLFDFYFLQPFFYKIKEKQNNRLR